LPNAVVDVDSVIYLSLDLDNFWKLEDVKYDYIVDLTGTGDQGMQTRRLFLKPRVCGFEGLQTRVPGYPGLITYVSPAAGPC